MTDKWVKLGGPVVELSDGRWLQLAEPWVAYDGTQPYDIRAHKAWILPNLSRENRP